MCTAATYKTNDFYFGRTLDYESSYGEEIVIMPRNFPLNFVNMGRIATHYAVIGTAHVAQDYPLSMTPPTKRVLPWQVLTLLAMPFTVMISTAGTTLRSLSLSHGYSVSVQT